MSTQIQTNKQTYEEHEQQTIQELQPSGLLMTAHARNIASILWQIETINRAIEGEIEATKQAWVNQELHKIAAKNMSMQPIAGYSALNQFLSASRGLVDWGDIINGKEVEIRGEQLTDAYLILADEAGYVSEGELDEESDDYCGVWFVPNENGQTDQYLIDYELEKLESDWSVSRVLYVHGVLCESAEKAQKKISFLKAAMLYVRNWLNKCEKWDKMLLKEENRLNAQALPIELMVPILDKSRKVKAQLSSDLFREQKRFIELQAMYPVITIEHVKPSLNMLY